MSERYVSIWFRYLKTDWFSRRQPNLHQLPFVLATPDHGRMMITSSNAIAQAQGIENNMVLADARAIISSLHVINDPPDLAHRLLRSIAKWCIRYSPVIAADLPDGIIINATGCAHLWGGEKNYLEEISRRFDGLGYHVNLAMADTIGAAWALSHCGEKISIVKPGDHKTAILSLPPEALRLEDSVTERLHKLGLHHIGDFIDMPRKAFARRFGNESINRIDQALGLEKEIIHPVIPLQPYQERLTCIEPIITATGIEIALRNLLDSLCLRFQREEKGLRSAIFKCYRTDLKIEKIEIATNRPSHHTIHLFKLFENSIGSLEPDPGIELFTLEAHKVESVTPAQVKFWEKTAGLENIRLSELLDRLSGKTGSDRIHRYLPDEHYWPERAFKKASSILEKPATCWREDRPRPLQLLSKPELIDVMAVVPDYPPKFFRHRGKLHNIIKADGPERIEPEWWLEQGQHRDYYCVEDEEGHRYWLFRSGHCDDDRPQWFIHGFFA